jgi:hypothetical protein
MLIKLLEILEELRCELAVHHNLLVTDLPKEGVPENHWRLDNNALIGRMDEMLGRIVKDSEMGNCPLCAGQKTYPERAHS